MKGSTVLSESILTISSIIISFILIALVVRTVLTQQSSITYENLFQSIARDIALIIDREASLSSDTEIEYEIPKGSKVNIQIQYKSVFVNYGDKSVKKSFSGITKTGPYYFKEPQILCFIKRYYYNDIWIFDVPCKEAKIPELTTTTTTTTSTTTTTTIRIPWKDKKIPPIIFLRDDWMNGDWGNPDYYFSWATGEVRGHPEWGPTGGWWEQWDVGGDYGTWVIYNKVIPYIEKAQTMNVTMPDGKVGPKPIGVGVWFKKDPINQDRLNKLDNFVKTLAQEIEKYDNVKFFVIAGGSQYGEFQSGNDYYATTYMDIFGKYFKKIPFFIQCGTANCGGFSEHALTIDSHLAGVKANALHIEEINEYYYTIDDLNNDGKFDQNEKNNAKLIGGMLGFSKLYHEFIPTSLEQKSGFSLEQTYDVILKGLSNHPHFFSFGGYGSEVTKALNFEKKYGFPLLDFVRYHLGTIPQDTPDVWIVLRDSFRQKLSDCYVATAIKKMICAGPQPGDYEFWLYRRDDFPNSNTVVMKNMEGGMNELPSPAREYVYSQRAIRRTDQSNGGYYIYFDVDDRIYFANQVPESEGGKYSYQIQISFVNQGSDTLSLEYKNQKGELITKTITKGSTLGEVNQWIDYTFVLDDAYFNNEFDGKADFRINSNNDGGNEYIHRIIVTPVVSE